MKKDAIPCPQCENGYQIVTRRNKTEAELTGVYREDNLLVAIYKFCPHCHTHEEILKHSGQRFELVDGMMVKVK